MKTPSSIEPVGRWLFRWRGPLSGIVLLAVVGATYVVARGPFGGSIPGLAADLSGLTLVTLGMLLRVVVVAGSLPGTSGRNRRRQIADALNTRGWYALVRHPLYLANLVAWIGVAVISASWWIVAGTGALGLALYGPIILMEDAFLHRTFGEAHRQWAALTPALLPRSWHWRRSTHRTTWPVVLRREYSSAAGNAIAVYLVHVARVLDWSRPVSSSAGWTFGLTVVLTVTAAVRLVSHKTRLIDSSR